jgi:3'-phosphoadenosine 5'-phosphosulfate sulfotransferase (PAPS reductase)/FAD synthetase
MQRVINFSGGKTSAYMTIKYYKPGDLVIFCDTGREHFKTYKFINDFEAFENIPVIRLSYDGGFRRLLEKTKAIPNRFKRFCTIELKVKTARRYLRSIGLMKYENLVGFRFDEPLKFKEGSNIGNKLLIFFP